MVNKMLIVAGMPRAGTTWLYHNLCKHPNINSSVVKELSFFSDNYDLGEKWLMGQYVNPERANLNLDCSPEYFFHPSFPSRIREWKDNVSVVIVVRDKVGWMNSLYRQAKETDPSVINPETFFSGHTYRSYRFPLQVRLSDFSISERVSEIRNTGVRILLVNFSVLQNDPLRVLTAIEVFGAIKPYFTQHNIDRSVINAANGKFSIIKYASDHKYIGRIVKRFFPKFLQTIMSKALIRILKSKPHLLEQTSNDQDDIEISRLTGPTGICSHNITDR